MSNAKKYKELEKLLSKKHNNINENQVTLCDEDFKDGKLTAMGYEKTKAECDYIPYSKNIEIFVPKGNIADFKNSFEVMATVELKRIRKDRNFAQISALICLLVGAAFFTLGQIFNDIKILHEITLVTTWVFIWTAVDKFFFGRFKLRDQRFNLLQILSSKVTEYEK